MTRLSSTLLLALTLTPAAWSQGPPPQAVRIDPVRKERVQKQRRVTGELRATRRAAVATQEQGVVLELLVREGQRLEQGEVIARLDGLRLEIERDRLQADLEVALAVVDERTASAEQARSDEATLVDLTRRGATNPKELADARTAVKAAAARLREAQEQVKVIRARGALLEKRVADTEIRAPFAGTVTERFSEIGQWVAEGDALVEMVALRPIEAWLSVPQDLLASVRRPGTRISVQVHAVERAFPALRLRPVPRIDSRARTFLLVAELDNPGELLAPGMSVTAGVPTGIEEERLTISKNAVLRNDVGPFVFVARGGGAGQPAQADPVPVEIVATLEKRVAVSATRLQVGDAVITEGKERLFPMAPVLPAPQTPSETASPGGEEARRS